MLKKIIPFIIILLMKPFYAKALTIDDTVMLALESNNIIKSQEFQLGAKKLAADSAMLIFFPSLVLQYGYDYSWDNLISNKKDASGDTSNFSAYASLNLFNGLSDLYTFQIAGLNRDMAESQLTATSYDIILDAQNAYINLLKAKSDLEVAESNLKLLLLQKRDAEISAANGLIAKNDLLQTEAYLASAKLQRITAASAITIARQKLEKVINRRLDDREQLVEPVFLEVTLAGEDELKDKMFKNRSDLRQLEQSYEAAKKTENSAISGALPKIDMKAGFYGYGGNANPFSGTTTGPRDDNVAVGVTASWNLIGIATSTVDTISKKKERQALAYTIADNKQNMVLDLQSAIESYYTSQAQLVQAKAGVNHAEENYRVRKNLYDQSAATMTELLDASSLLNQAKVAESNARYGVLSSIYRLERTIQEKLPASKGEGIVIPLYTPPAESIDNLIPPVKSINKGSKKNNKKK